MDAICALAEAAPAKINLALHVTGRRADGYHELESLAVFTAFGDRILVEPTAADRFTIDGPFASGLDTGAGNLALRARDALRRALDTRSASSGSPPSGPPLPPVAIHLEKNVPVAAGIGGGSGDAAAVLRALTRHLRLDGAALLAALAPALGADVPMCLASRPLIARGIGERIEPVAGLPELALVLVNPGVAVSTPAVFAALAGRANPPLPPLPARRDLAALVGWLCATRNDLEAPALGLAPAVAECLAALRANGALFARMSGSGATCFGICESPAHASRAAGAIGRARPGWFVTATSTAG